jgi:hypothetical protein
MTAFEPISDKGVQVRPDMFVRFVESYYLQSYWRLEMQNPFLYPSVLNCPLSIETVQEINLSATKRAFISQLAGPIFATQNPTQLGDRVQRFGWEDCLVHPDDLASVFENISTDLYRAIVDLYCDLTGRSILTIHRIFERMAGEAGLSPPSYEAVWTICRHLDVLREKKAVISTTVLNTIWYVCLVPTAIKTVDKHGEICLPEVLLVISATRPARIIGFKLSTPCDRPSNTLQTLYEALAVQRKPAPRETAGISWCMPCMLRAPQAT